MKKKQIKHNIKKNEATNNKEKKITQEDRLLFWQGLNSQIGNKQEEKINLNKIFKDNLVFDGLGNTKKASQIYDEVMPKNDKYTINDNAYNPYTSTASVIPPNYFNNVNALLINNFFLGYGELSLLAQNPIISNICSIRADEIISKWIKFNSTSDTDKSEKIKILEKWFKDKKIKEIFREAITKSFLFGGCQVYIKIANDEEDVKNEQKEREQPLIIDKLKIDKNSVEYLQVIEPVWYTAIYWQSFNPLLPDFYKPQKYSVLGRTLHQSRMLHFKYKEMPDILKPTYMFNGIPLAQEITAYLMGFEQSRINLNKLIAKSNHFKLGTNIEAMIEDESSAFVSGTNVGTRISMFNRIQSVANVIAIDKETEDFENVSVNVQGLDDIMNQNVQYVCSIARIPVSKLFQNSLKGLNPTGEFETNSFYDTIKEDRANMVDEHLTATVNLSMIDCFGDIDEDINWEWLPLEEANEVEASQIKLNKANEIATLVNSGVIDALQGAKKLQSDKDSGWNDIEIVESEDTELNIDEE